MDKYVTVKEFEDFQKFNKEYINAVASALFITFSPTAEKWEEFCNNFQEEFERRNMTPPDTCLDRRYSD